MSFVNACVRSSTSATPNFTSCSSGLHVVDNQLQHTAYIGETIEVGVAWLRYFANMHTALTEVLGLAVPVIAAPMAKVSEADLAAAAAKAGALGCVAAGKIAIERLAEVYRAAAQQLEGNDRNHSALGIGVFNYNCSKVHRTDFCASVRNLVYPY